MSNSFPIHCLLPGAVVGDAVGDAEAAREIAAGELSPLTGREWGPALKQNSLIGFQAKHSEGERGAGGGQRRGATGNPYNYHETAAARMPGKDDLFLGWTLPTLATLLTVNCTSYRPL